jgi:hypothetical protein
MLQHLRPELKDNENPDGISEQNVISENVTPIPQQGNRAIDTNLPQNDLEAANDASVIKGKKSQDAQTRINAAIKEYISTLKKAVFHDSGIIVRTAIKPRVMYFRGKGWFTLNSDTGAWSKIGDTSDEAVKYWNRKSANLRRKLGEISKSPEQT